MLLISWPSWPVMAIAEPQTSLAPATDVVSLVCELLVFNNKYAVNYTKFAFQLVSN